MTPQVAESPAPETKPPVPETEPAKPETPAEVEPESSIPLPITFSIDRKTFARELELVSSVVEKKTTIPILANIRLEAKADPGSTDGSIELIGTDLEHGIVSHIEGAYVLESGAITLPAALLTKTVKGFKGDAVAISKGDGICGVKVACGSAKSEISGAMSVECFPDLPKPTGKGFTLPNEVLLDAVRLTSYAISAEESRFTLNGALVEVKDGVFRMVATDGHRLALFERKVKTKASFRALIPRPALNILKTLLSDSGHFTVQEDEDHLFVAAGKFRLLVSRKLKGNFPDWSRVIPAGDNYKTIIEVDRKEFLETLKRVREYADVRSRLVHFESCKDGLTLRAVNLDTGSSTKMVGGVYHPGSPHKPQSIGFHADYVIQYLKAETSDKVLLRIDEPTKAATLVAWPEHELQYVIMPMRT